MGYVISPVFEGNTLLHVLLTFLSTYSAYFVEGKIEKCDEFAAAEPGLFLSLASAQSAMWAGTK